MPMVPGVPGYGLPTDDVIVRRIQELERAVRELAAANPLATAGLVPRMNGLTVQGELDITGPTTIGGTLGVTGTTTLGAPTSITGDTTVSGSLSVTGPMTVGGSLSLPAGIIGNDALTNPVSFAGNKGSVNAVVPPASYGTACTANLTIPAWAQSVVVLAVATMGATSSGSPGGAVTGDILIDGTAGDADTLTLASGASGNFTVLAQRTYTPTAPTIDVSLSWFAQNAIAGASARLIAVAIVGR